MRGNYQTEGRMRLEAFLAEHPDRQFTVDELCQAINGSAERGKSSIYRRLSELCQAERVRRFQSTELPCSLYQYIGESCTCRNHFHSKCLQCGTIEHLDCGDSAEFAKHLLAEHGFSIDCGRSVLYGLCSACRKKEEQV